jgi:hypothetical protein
MPEDQAGKAARSSRLRPHIWILWFLSLGLLVSLAENIRQDRKTNALAMDLATLRQDSQKQLAALREAQSGLLEQDLLRLDQVTTQFQKSSADELHQAASLASRTRAELAKTVEQRHQEMITAISDLRMDLRSEARARENQLNDVQKLDAEATHVSSVADSSAANPATPPARLVSEEKNSDEQVSQASAQKKGFWSRLNPFGRNKSKKQDSGDEGPAN